MRNLKKLSWLLAISLSIVSARADLTKVSVDIQTKVSPVPTATPDPKQPARPESHTMKLEISLRNISHDDLKDLTVKYYVFAHSTGQKDLAILLNGEKPIAVPPNGTAKVESEVATATFTPAYRTKDTSGVMKQIPATGSKLSGYGARVFQGDKVVGEYFTSDTGKAAVDAAKAPGK